MVYPGRTKLDRKETAGTKCRISCFSRGRGNFASLELRKSGTWPRYWQSTQHTHCSPQNLYTQRWVSYHTVRHQIHEIMCLVKLWKLAAFSQATVVTWPLFSYFLFGNRSLSGNEDRCRLSPVMVFCFRLSELLQVRHFCVVFIFQPGYSTSIELDLIRVQSPLPSRLLAIA